MLVFFLLDGHVPSQKLSILLLSEERGYIRGQLAASINT